MNSRLSRIVSCVVVVGCYLTSFFLTTLYLIGKANTNGQPTTIGGLGAFFDGIFAMFDRQFAWMANPLAGLALLFFLARLYSVSLVLSLVAVLLAQQTWVVVGTTISGDEGGVTQYLVTSLGPGFYLWSFSFLLLAVLSLWHWLRSGHRDSSEMTQLAEQTC